MAQAKSKNFGRFEERRESVKYNVPELGGTKAGVQALRGRPRRGQWTSGHASKQQRAGRIR